MHCRLGKTWGREERRAQLSPPPLTSPPARGCSWAAHRDAVVEGLGRVWFYQNDAQAVSQLLQPRPAAGQHGMLSRASSASRCRGRQPAAADLAPGTSCKDAQGLPLLSSPGSHLILLSTFPVRGSQVRRGGSLPPSPVTGRTVRLSGSPVEGVDLELRVLGAVLRQKVPAGRPAVSGGQWACCVQAVGKHCTCCWTAVQRSRWAPLLPQLVACILPFKNGADTACGGSAGPAAGTA